MRESSYRPVQQVGRGVRLRLRLREDAVGEILPRRARDYAVQRGVVQNVCGVPLRHPSRRRSQGRIPSGYVIDHIAGDLAQGAQARLPVQLAEERAA